MSQQGRVVVIGGGIIGAMSAWYLRKSGREVTIVDKDRFGAACSHGNCGYVSPSHVLPLPQPGAVSGTLKAMFGPGNPFYIKPRFSPTLWMWLLKFARRCNKRDMMEAGSARHAILQSSRQLYEELITSEDIECEWDTSGLLFVHQSKHHFEEYEKIDKLLRDEFGVGATPHEGDKLIEIEPSLKPGVGGGWHYETDAWLRPDRLMAALKTKLESAGVEIKENCDVKSFVRQNGKATALMTSAGDLEGATFVVATGALTPFLNQHLGCKVPIQPGKGYSITMPRPDQCPTRPMIFEEHRVAVTPLQTGYRIGSTMEFAGYDTTVNRTRLGMLAKGAEHYLHEPHCEPIQEEWYGWRPMTWDGKPFIDKSPAMSNVWVAAGHNMLGLSMGTGTGRLITEMINGETPHIDPKPYSFDRL
jgi:D-amino-acid dehydrogenase